MSEPQVIVETPDDPKPSLDTDEPRDFHDSDLDFLAGYRRSSDYPQLRCHVVEFWREVKAKVYVYGCIQNFMFLVPRIQQHPVSAAVVHSYKATILKDPGNAREFGYKLFEDKEELDVHSYFGSMADSTLVSAQKADTPLAPFRGKVHYVWAAAVLHCLSEEDVSTLLQNVFLLLRPGGTFFGDCGGTEPAGPWPTREGQPARYLHSQATLKEALERVGFSEVSVSHVELPSPQDSPAQVEATARIRELGREPAMLSFAAKKA